MNEEQTEERTLEAVDHYCDDNCEYVKLLREAFDACFTFHESRPRGLNGTKRIFHYIVLRLFNDTFPLKKKKVPKGKREEVKKYIFKTYEVLVGRFLGSPFHYNYAKSCWGAVLMSYAILKDLFHKGVNQSDYSYFMNHIHWLLGNSKENEEEEGNSFPCVDIRMSQNDLKALVGDSLSLKRTLEEMKGKDDVSD